MSLEPWLDDQLELPERKDEQNNQEEVRQDDPFPTDKLPKALADFIREGSKSIDCDESLLALSVLAVSASAIGNAAVLEVKPGYRVKCVFWGVIIGPSGCGKTPAISMSLAPFRERQGEWAGEYEDAKSRYKREKAVYDKKIKKWEKDGDNAEMPLEPILPTQKRLFTGETTIQAMLRLAGENDWGVMLAADELDTWFGSFNKHSNGGGDDSLWLQLHNGEPFVFDRVSSGTTYVHNAAVCVLGGIQEERLRTNLSKANRRESGMSSRLLKCLSTRQYGGWSDTGLSEATSSAYRDLVLSFVDIGFAGKDANGKSQPHVLKLSPDAYAKVKEFNIRTSHEKEGQNDEIAATMQKLTVYMLVFATIFHYEKTCTNSELDQLIVDLDSVNRAVVVADWFKRESIRVYDRLGPSTAKSGTAERETTQADYDKAIEIINRNRGRMTPGEFAPYAKWVTGGLASKAATFLQRMVDLGHGTWEDTKRARFFVPTPRSLEP